MDPEKRSLIATALVGIVVLAIIIGSIYYLIQFIRNRQNPTNVASNQVQASVAPAASGVVINQVQDQNQGVSGDYKTYNAGEYQITYPKTWGLLTCTNSENVEFDPTNPADQKIDCSIATKPITIIKNAVACSNGTIADVGQIKVAKTKVNEGNYVRYEWCTKTVPALYVTHRVSPNGEQATSKEDYSKQVEDMISKLSFVRGS